MRCVAVLGPSQSGKSTLVDALAAIEGPGQRMALSEGLDLVSFGFLGEHWAALDCPGSIEAICQTRSALIAADAAIICVPPDPEATVLAAPFLRAVAETMTPTLIFINRIDEPRGRVRDIIAGLQDFTESPIVLRQIPIREGEVIVGAVDLISERTWRYRPGERSALVQMPADVRERETEARNALLEHLADYDDWLLNELIEDHEPATDAVYTLTSRILAARRLTPAFIGSAANASGVLRLMKALRHEAPHVAHLAKRLTETASGSLPDAARAIAFHAHHRPHTGKLVAIRALAEGVRAGQPLGGGNLGAVMEATGASGGAGGIEVGGIALVAKSDHLEPRHLLGRDVHVPARETRLPAMLAVVLTARHERDDAKLSGALEKLAACDPGLRFEAEPGTGRPLVHLQGPLSLKSLLKTLRETFGIEAEEHYPASNFRETIAHAADVHHRHRKQTGGSGQFADVKLTVSPNPRGTGFTFADRIKGGAVPANYIPSVEAGARDALERGPLGFPVIDIDVVLTDGQFHSVDSSDFAFRTAARAAVREALERAGPVQLQPIHTVEIHAPSVFSGALVPLMSVLHGQVLGFDSDPEAQGWDRFRANLPEPALAGLVHKLRSVTQGIGYFESAFDHYR